MQIIFKLSYWIYYLQRKQQITEQMIMGNFAWYHKFIFQMLNK